MLRLQTLFLVLASALPASASPRLASSDSATVEIEQLEHDWNAARIRRDAPRLDALLSDDWVLVHGDGRLDTKQGYLSSFESGDRRIGAIEMSELRVRRYGDAVVAVLRSKSSVWRGGQGPVETDQRFTHVWVRSCAGWKMVSSHAASVDTR